MLRSVIHQLPLNWAFRLALLRLLARWQSLLTIVVGVVLAAAIGANVPLYTTAVAQVGMVQRLDQQPPADVHVFSRISLTSLDVDDLDATWRAVDDVVQVQVAEAFAAGLPDWVDQAVTWGETAPMLVVYDGVDIDATRIRVAYFDNWPEQVRLIEGELPAEPTAPGVDMEAALNLSASISLGLEVGDEVVLDQRGWDSSIPFTVLITAIVREEDELAPYWMEPSPLRVESSSQWELETNLLTTRESFLRAATQYVPQTRSVIGWRVLFDHSQLPFSEIPQALTRLQAFDTNLHALLAPAGGRQLNLVYSTSLIPILTQYAGEVGLLGAPFTLLLLQIGALVLFFLVATATLVRRGERRELAMLQSRGAFDRQIIALRGVEALIIVVLGALLAPFIAQQLLVWLTPVFTGIERMPLLLDTSTFIYAGAAAGTAFVALIGTLRPVLRQPLVLAGGSAARSEKQAWWQRYYIDVILFLVGISALWFLVSEGSPLTATQIGQDQTADPLLLLAPALLFLALGSMLLRLFPEVMGLLARILSRGRGLGGALATWQVSRESVHYGRITFLLALAIGIGWFATSFRATVDRSHSDQARYSVGTDVRLEERNIVLDADQARPLDTYLAMPEVVAASTAMRFINTDLSNDRQQPLAGEVLAIDPDTFGSVIYWRSDLGAVKSPRPPGQPVELPTPGRVLPFTPDRIALWARMDVLGASFSASGLYQPDLDRLLERTQLYVRLRDEAGTFIHLPLTVTEVEWERNGTDTAGMDMRSFNTSGWAYFQASLSDAPVQPQGELSLEAIYWRHNARNPQFENDDRMSLASLTLYDADGTATALNWLELGGWELVYDSGGLIQGTTGVGAAPDRPALRSRQVIWDQRGGQSILGLVLDYPETGLIPAIASSSLLEANRINAGDTLPLVNIARVSPVVQILDSVDYFPTLYQDVRPFLIVDQEALLYAINRRPSAAVYPDEVWLRLASGVSSNAFADTVDAEGDASAILDATTLEGALRTLQTNPLSLGLMGLLFLAFIVALALSVVGLLTYAALTAQSRRSEFGVLRALGYSLTRLVMSLAFEQILVILTGSLLGVALGMVLSNQVVPTLAIGATGERITPPFVVQVEVAALVQYGLIMLVVLVAVLAASLLLVRRMSLAQTLRLGEE
ncbi:MAG: FtsX-like permease family protein [Anaerolineae bacterium]|nr:FtsX-like permease family protein [Anaerolineae bacterium]